MNCRHQFILEQKEEFFIHMHLEITGMIKFIVVGGLS